MSSIKKLLFSILIIFWTWLFHEKCFTKFCQFLFQFLKHQILVKLQKSSSFLSRLFSSQFFEAMYHQKDLTKEYLHKLQNVSLFSSNPQEINVPSMSMSMSRLPPCLLVPSWYDFWENDIKIPLILNLTKILAG